MVKESAIITSDLYKTDLSFEKEPVCSYIEDLSPEYSVPSLTPDPLVIIGPYSGTRVLAPDTPYIYECLYGTGLAYESTLLRAFVSDLDTAVNTLH